MAFGIAALTLLAIGGLVIWARSRGRRVGGVPEVLAEPPEDIHPGELAVLWGSFRRGSPLLAATGLFDPGTQRSLYQTELLHLAQQRVIEMEAVGSVSDPDDLRIYLRKNPEPIDEGFVRFLFGEGATVRTLREVAGSSNAAVFGQWAGGLRSKVMLGMVTTQMQGGGLPGGSIAGIVHWAMRSFMPLARQSRGWIGGITPLVGIGGAVGAGLAQPSPPWEWVLPAACVGAGFLARAFIPYRVPAAFRERLARWGAFRRFLVSHAEMDDAPALAVAIWERYLVYATAMQAANEVEEQVRRVVPVSALLIPWLGGMGWVRTIQASAPAPVRISRSAAILPGPSG